MKNQTIYEKMKKNQLKAKWNFDFTNTLIQQVNNDFWQQKKQLWYIMSAACNDAAEQYYIKIRDYVKNLVDIDTCNIHQLKSIAQSVGASQITDFIKQDFPCQLENLINLFSIKSSKLLQLNENLNIKSLYPLYGNLDNRNCLLLPEKIYMSVVQLIFNNINKIQKLLQSNNSLTSLGLNEIYTNSKIQRNIIEQIWKKTLEKFPGLTNTSKIYFFNPLTNKLDFFTFDETYWAKYIKNDQFQQIISDEISEYFEDPNIQFIKYKNYNELNGYLKDIYSGQHDSLPLNTNLFIANIKNIQKVFNFILKIYLQQQEEQQKKSEKQKLLNKLLSKLNSKLNTKFYDEQSDQLDISETQKIKRLSKLFFQQATLCVEYKGTYFLNSFYLLTESIKAFLFTQNMTNTFKNYYIQQQSNITIDMSQILKNIIQIINKYDQSYLKYFMQYYFYNLFYTKIKNNIIKEDFQITRINQKVNINYVSKISQLTYDSFYSQLSSYLSTKQINQLLCSETQEQKINNNTTYITTVPITHYNKEYIDFGIYLFIINSVCGYDQTVEQKLFPYKMYYYNNDLDITDDLNIKYRLLMGISNDGTIISQQNYIDKVAKQFVDLCLKISYARQNIKALIQQYSFIGTQKIITNIIRDYFIKNFSRRSDWRFISDTSLQKQRTLNNPFKTIKELNGTSNDAKFQANIIEYYDNTQYLNIIADLPEFIYKYIPYEATLQSSYITSQSGISTWTLDQDVTSTILSTLPYQIPDSLYPKASNQPFVIPAVTISASDFQILNTVKNINDINLQLFKSNVVNQLDQINEIISIFTNTYNGNISTFNSKIVKTNQEFNKKIINEFPELSSSVKTALEQYAAEVNNVLIDINKTYTRVINYITQYTETQSQQLQNFLNYDPISSVVSTIIDESEYVSQKLREKQQQISASLFDVIISTYFDDISGTIQQTVPYIQFYADTYKNTAIYTLSTDIINCCTTNIQKISGFTETFISDYNNFINNELTPILEEIKQNTNQQIQEIIINESSLSGLGSAPTGVIQVSPEIRVSANIIPSAGLVTSFVIPAGTQVSANIPANTFVTTQYISTLYQPVYALCSDFVTEYNQKFWQRDLTILSYTDLQDQIIFYQNYFDNLKMAKSTDLKRQIYIEQVYPVLSSVWQAHATSGLLDVNKKLHYQYAGQMPCNYPTINLGNKIFTTVATIPFIPNLKQCQSQNITKNYIINSQLYNVLTHYMNMLFQEVYNMYKINNNFLGIPQDGWRQTNIEMYGYSSQYQSDSNILQSDSMVNQRIDFTGPWQYSSLKEFLRLYIEAETDNNIISYENLEKFVNEFYFQDSSLIKKNIITKLLNYQKYIIDKQNYKIYSFETDIYKNEFVLFKHKDHNNYQDAGEIWVKIKNYQLSVPLMNNNIKIGINNYYYKNDQLDTLQFNEDCRYANMFKQLCNNALQFGISDDIIWILGHTDYVMNSSDRLIRNVKSLKIVCARYTLNQIYKTLIIDSSSVRSASINQTNDILNSINEFIGVYTTEKTLDIVLFDHKNSPLTLTIDKNNYDEINNADFSLKITKLNIQDKDNIYSQINNIEFNNVIYPALSVISGSFIYDSFIFKDKVKFIDIIGQSFYSKLNIFNQPNIYAFGTLYIINNQLCIKGQLATDISIDKSYEIFDKSFEYYGQFQAVLCNNILENLNNYNQIEFSNVVSFVFSTLTTTGSLSDITNVTNWNITYNFQKQISSFINSYQSIWRLCVNNDDISIAYEAINSENITEKKLKYIYNLSKSEQIKKIGIMNYKASIISKQVNDADGNAIFLNQFKDLSAFYSADEVFYKYPPVKENLILIQQEYPYCNLDIENNLNIKYIASTMGGKKNIFVNRDDISFSDPYNSENLINGLISDTQSGAIQLLNETIELSSIYWPTNFNVFSSKYNYEKIKLSNNIEQYQTALSSNTLSGYINFYEYYDKYIEAKNNNESIQKQVQLLLKYNNVMSKLNSITKFSPVITDFLNEPMKIICNFGDFKNNYYTLMGSQYFDLDINIYLNTINEMNKRIGWKCGRRQTEYLLWVSDDQRHGGPQIATVNIEKYKTNNKYEKQLNIIINACWFIESQIQTQNPNILINWKGFTYHYIVEDIFVNEACCDYPFLQVTVNLETNELYCSRSTYLPTLIKQKNSNSYYYGFIRKYQNQLSTFFNYKPSKYLTTVNNEYQIYILNKYFYKYNNGFTNTFDDSTLFNDLNLVGLKNKKINNMQNIIDYNKKFMLEYETQEYLEFYSKKIIVR